MIKNLGNDLPGILGVFEANRHVEISSNHLAQTVLRNLEFLTDKEAETIAVFASKHNDTPFCINSHQAVVDALEGDVSINKMRPLLDIAYQTVHLETVDFSKYQLEKGLIIEVIAIAAAFCYFNRLVTAINPTESDDYQSIGKQLAEKGYF